jgi:hypothetical protein
VRLRGLRQGVLEGDRPDRLAGAAVGTVVAMDVAGATTLVDTVDDVGTGETGHGGHGLSLHNKNLYKSAP